MVQLSIEEQQKPRVNGRKVLEIKGKIHIKIFLLRFFMSYNEQFHEIYNVHVGIAPNSWYHQCTSLDTESGEQLVFFLSHPKLFNRSHDCCN